MKLYATVKSDRATKGQGGNKCIEIVLMAFDRVHPIGTIVLEVLTDGNDEDRQYLLTWQDATWGDRMILREGHEKEGLIQTAEAPPARNEIIEPWDIKQEDNKKGKKKKGEKCYCSDDEMSIPHIH